MPKMKTKSGAKKRFRVTASGKIKFKAAFARHMQMNKPKKMKLKTRGSSILSKVDTKIILDNFLPYQRKRKNKKAAVKSSAAAE